MKSIVTSCLVALILPSACQKSGSSPAAAPSATATATPEAGASKRLGPRSQGQGDQGGRRGGRGGGPVAVRTQRIAAQSLPRTIEVVAVLTGRKQADVYSRVAGKLSYIGPAEGERVKAGELLFRIDRSDPGESFLATPATSPIAGWVGRWLITSIGAQVTAQEPVVTIVDDEVLRATVHLPTDQWLKVSRDTSVRVHVGTQVRPAAVTGIARSAEAASARGAVTVDIANEDHQWKSGMVAVVAFDLERKPRIAIPAAALSLTDQGAFVFTVVNDKAKRTKVRFVTLDNDQVEILEGLGDGAELIVEGVNQVGDDLPVKVAGGTQEVGS